MAQSVSSFVLGFPKVRSNFIHLVSQGRRNELKTGMAIRLLTIAFIVFAAIGYSICMENGEIS